MRAARGEAVERPPAWMMRQAGRYMKVYQDLCKRHTSFRERSEAVDLVVDISLQPIRAFKPDGCILFSDILTTLQGVGFDGYTRTALSRWLLSQADSACEQW